MCNGLGYILGDFFTNSSGHPGEGEVREGQRQREKLRDQKRTKKEKLQKKRQRVSEVDRTEKSID
jgi:hypothetical protein